MNILQNARLCLAAAMLLAIPAWAQAAPLKVIDVGAPAINCIFNVNCTITVTDTVGNIPLPGISGTARLQSRTFMGVLPAPGAGKHAYQYRVDLTQAVGVGSIPCVIDLKLDFGPITKLPYANSPLLGDIYVVTSGGLGSIGIASADRVGNVTTITFSKPVCAGSSVGKGDTSFFFGLAEPKTPKASIAQIQLSGGGLVNVPARVPVH